MNHLRRFNENNQELSKDDLQNFFAHTFDLCESGSATVIDIVYFNPNSKMDWAHNDFSGMKLLGAKCDQRQLLTCVEGFELSFHHDFYDKAKMEDFDSYYNIVNQLKEDVDRFKTIYKPSEIFFENGDDSIIRLLIRP